MSSLGVLCRERISKDNTKNDESSIYVFFLLNEMNIN